MSRTDPEKKKPRSASRTLLVYGEGISEEVFLKYLKSLYSYGKNVAVTVRRGKGGSPYNIVVDASNDFSAFDKRIIILDNDKSEIEMQKARQEAVRRNIELIENNPCLESLLLSILEPSINHAERSSSELKKHFKNGYLGDDKTITEIKCKKIFPLSVIEDAQSKNPFLKRIIEIIKGGF